MYIAHFLLLYYAVQYAQRLTGETFPDFSFQAGLIYIAIFVGATIIVSYATFVLIEQPFQRIGAALAIRCGQRAGVRRRGSSAPIRDRASRTRGHKRLNEGDFFRPERHLLIIDLRNDVVLALPMRLSVASITAARVWTS